MSSLSNVTAPYESSGWALCLAPLTVVGLNGFPIGALQRNPVTEAYGFAVRTEPSDPVETDPRGTT